MTVLRAFAALAELATTFAVETSWVVFVSWVDPQIAAAIFAVVAIACLGFHYSRCRANFLSRASLGEW